MVLQGECTLGAGAEVGPDCHIVDSVVGPGAKVTKSTVLRAEIGEDARVGPFAVLGPGAQVARRCRSGPVHPAGGRLPGLRLTLRSRPGSTHRCPGGRRDPGRPGWERYGAGHVQRQLTVELRGFTLVAPSAVTGTST